MKPAVLIGGIAIAQFLLSTVSGQLQGKEQDKKLEEAVRKEVEKLRNEETK